MQAVKSKNSQIELALGKALWTRGLRYRKNDRTVIGKPDFVFKKHKIAVFCDSEFWHGKDWEVRKNDLKSHQEFWIAKIERNIERDKEVNEKLISEGWSILRFWGKRIMKDAERCADEVEVKFRKNSEMKNKTSLPATHYLSNYDSAELISKAAEDEHPYGSSPL